MLSGHAGSLATVHASTPRDAAIRLETLCLLSDVSLPAHVARLQVSSSIDIVVQIERFRDGSRRIRTISECLGLDESDNYLIRDIFRFHSAGLDEEGRLVGELRWTGEQPSFASEPFELGLGDRVNLTGQLFKSPG
jgi:pilus assembly protein CpaF